MRKNTKFKDKFFSFNIKPVGMNIIVFYSEDFERIHKHLNKKKNKWESSWLKQQTKEFTTPDKESGGGVTYNKETNKPLILFLRAKKRDWYYYECLIHEISHLVFCLSKLCSFEDESEFQAYLTSYLFKEIRLKLYDKKD